MRDHAFTQGYTIIYGSGGSYELAWKDLQREVRRAEESFDIEFLPGSTDKDKVELDMFISTCRVLLKPKGGVISKSFIMNQLKNDVFCRLAPTATGGGVGVVAIRDIPAGTEPFVGCDDSAYSALITEDDLDGIDLGVARLFRDVFVKDENGFYWVPARGLQAIDISYYLNHSKEPNMRADPEGEHFYAIDDIPAGSELLVDYDTYDFQDDHDYGEVDNAPVKPHSETGVIKEDDPNQG